MTSNTIIKQTLELEELAIDLDISNDKQESTPDENLQITLTQQKLQRMKSNLDSITDTLGKNRSLLSKAAELLNNIPGWGKIILGLVITLPILITGLILHMGLLLLITGMIALGCVMTGLLLDEHYHSTVDMTKEIKACMSGIADLMAETIEVLAKTIDALNTLRQQLSEEINRLQDENILLGQNIDAFQEKINELTEANTKISRTAKLLQTTLDTFIKNSFEANNSSEALLEKMEDIIQRSEQFVTSTNELQQDLSTTGKQIASAAEVISLFTNQLLQSQAPLNPEQKHTFALADNSYCFYNKDITTNKPEISQMMSDNEPVSSSSSRMG